MSDDQPCADCRRPFPTESMVTLECHPLCAMTGLPAYETVCCDCFAAAVAGVTIKDEDT